MTKLVLVGASLTAGGHPSPCGSTASGSVQGSSSVTIGGTPLAARQKSSMNFPSHGHDIDDDGNCISFFGHSIQPNQNGLTDTLTLGGEPVYLDGSSVSTDPGSGGSVNVVNNGGNTSVTI